MGATGTGVDTTVLSIKITYDSLGRRTNITSYPSNDCTGTPLNEVVYEYDDFGALSKEYQEHEGAKDGSTLYVGYNYDTTSGSGAFTKSYRLKSVTYPNGRVVHHTYRAADSIADKLARPDAVERAGRGIAVVGGFARGRFRIQWMGCLRNGSWTSKRF